VAKTRELSDKKFHKKVSNKFQNWSDKPLDKKNGLNIIDKPVTKNDLVPKDRSIKIERATSPVRDA